MSQHMTKKQFERKVWSLSRKMEKAERRLREMLDKADCLLGELNSAVDEISEQAGVEKGDAGK